MILVLLILAYYKDWNLVRESDVVCDFNSEISDLFASFLFISEIHFAESCPSRLLNQLSKVGKTHALLSFVKFATKTSTSCKWWMRWFLCMLICVSVKSIVYCGRNYTLYLLTVKESMHASLWENLFSCFTSLVILCIILFSASLKTNDCLI